MRKVRVLQSEHSSTSVQPSVSFVLSLRPSLVGSSVGRIDGRSNDVASSSG